MIKKLSFLIFLLFFNFSFAFDINYQFLTDYNYDKFLIKVVNLSGKPNYYICEINNLNCSQISKSTKLNTIDNIFYSQDKSRSVFQIKKDKKNSYLTFFYIWPFAIKILPIEDKINNVIFDKYKIAVFIRKKIIIIPTLEQNNNQRIEISLPLNGYKFRFSNNLRDLFYLIKNNNNIEIYSLDTETKEKKLLTEINNNKNSIGFFEVLENKIFFTVNNNFTDVYIYDLQAKKLSKVFDENFLIDDVIKIENKIYFTANKDNPLIWSLYEFDPQTELITKIYENIAYEFKLTQMGDYLIFKSTGELPPQISLYNIKNKTFKNLNLNLQNEKIKLGEPFKIENTHSVLIKPDNFNPENEYDLIVWLHGGPMRQTSVGYHPYFGYGVYDYILENLRKNNFLIVKIDYTGSWGYGKKYQNILKENIGKLDAESVIKVVSYLKNNYKIKNVNLIGNSYGGYLSLKTIYEQPEMFHSAISINGVSDWWALIKKIPSSIFKDYFNGIPNSKNKILYDQASIFLNPEKLKNKKIILIYGLYDQTIPNEQNYIFYDKYKNIANFSLLELEDYHAIENKESVEKILNLLLKELK